MVRRRIAPAGLLSLIAWRVIDRICIFPFAAFINLKITNMSALNQAKEGANLEGDVSSDGKEEEAG